MAPTDFMTLKGKFDPGVISAQDWFVLHHRWAIGAPYMPTTLTDAAGVLQTLPDAANWHTSGEVQEKGGVDLSPETKTSAIRGYGSRGPRREIITEEPFTIDYVAQEWRKINQEIYHGVPLDGVNAQPGIGYRARRPGGAPQRYYSTLLVAKDAPVDAEIYPWFAFGKTAVTKRGKTGGQIGQEMPLPTTLTVYEDTQWGALYDWGIAGAGFDDIAEGLGFLTAATSITVSPAVGELAVAEVLALTVRDNAGFTRTADCVFASSAPAVATVSPAGVVSAVAAGSATITATLGALTDTCAVTVS